MKFIAKIGLAFLLIFSGCHVQHTDELGLIPKPLNVKIYSGRFVIDSTITIRTNSKENEIKYVTGFLQERFLKAAGINLKESADTFTLYPVIKFIISDTFNNEEAYSLKVDSDVVVSAANSHGLFYGLQTLLQLLPPEIYSDTIVERKLWAIKKVAIYDKPQFKWRGMHLDVGRHFFSVEYIKKYIDYLAYHKMNRFHWHLTEDQGWRIEIKRYPKLTSLGAFRKETRGDGKPYGGFYTQDDIREIVDYAEKRFVTIVPEIEMPGHSLAALAAYPELSCTGGPFEVGTEWGVFPDVYCAGKDITFKFLENVLTEVIDLFPGEYINIGGDECPKERWKECPDCQARIKSEGLKNEHELQSYFIKRIERFVQSKGKKIIGWDEILEGGLPPNAAVMSWRGTDGGFKAANSEHYVVMTPTSNCYFDYYQANPAYQPEAIGGFLPLEKVYEFNPIPDSLATEKRHFVLGAQGNVWTEYMENFSKVEFMVFPRIAAMAEVTWSASERKDYSNFLSRLNKQIGRYKTMKINYCTVAFR